MNLIPVDCNCGLTYRVDAHFNGRRMRCRSCGVALIVRPGPQPLSEATTAPPPNPSDRRGAWWSHSWLIFGVVIVAIYALFLIDGADRTQHPQTNLDSAFPASDTAPIKPETPCLAATKRPPSGETLFRASGRGLGSLRVTNGTSWDSLVMLFSGSQHYRVMFVRSNSTAVVNRIQAGQYRLQFQLGSELTNLGFCRIVGTSEFDDMLLFEEVNTNNGTRYDQMSVTLHGVVGGQAETTNLPASAFQLPHLVLPQ